MVRKGYSQYSIKLFDICLCGKIPVGSKDILMVTTFSFSSRKRQGEGVENSSLSF